MPEILRSKVALLVELYKRRAELERLNRELENARSALETERNRALESNEDLRREREQRYRAVFEHPSEMTVVLEAERDAQGQIVDWIYRDANSNALSLLGRTPRQVIGRRPARNVAGARRSHAAAMRAGTRGARAVSLRAGGRRAQLPSCLYPIGANMVVASGSDITCAPARCARWNAASAPRAPRREWLTAVLNSMTDEVYFADTQGRYTYANPAALREFGHETLSGALVTEVIGKLEVLRADGSPRPVSDAPPLRALRGEVVRDEEQIVRTPRTGEFRRSPGELRAGARRGGPHHRLGIGGARRHRSHGASKRRWPRTCAIRACCASSA